MSPVVVVIVVIVVVVIIVRVLFVVAMSASAAPKTAFESSLPVCPSVLCSPTDYWSSDRVPATFSPPALPTPWELVPDWAKLFWTGFVDAILGYNSTHSLATGTATVDSPVSLSGLLIAPALSSKNRWPAGICGIGAVGTATL